MSRVAGEPERKQMRKMEGKSENLSRPIPHVELHVRRRMFFGRLSPAFAFVIPPPPTESRSHVISPRRPLRERLNNEISVLDISMNGDKLKHHSPVSQFCLCFPPPPPLKSDVRTHKAEMNRTK